jgi:hypothetical protein
LKVGVLWWILLATSDQALGISKSGVPQLDEQDLSYYLDKPTQADNAHIHLFSSLSLISRDRALVSYELSVAPARGITPLLSLDIHPQMAMPLLSEFLDVTIWGQLNNLLRGDVELLTLEREILALFQELEELNARYIALTTAQPRIMQTAERPLTLDRRNYLQQRPKPGEEPGLSRTKQHEHDGEAEGLAPHVAARVRAGRVPNTEARASAAAAMRASEAQQDPEVTSSAPEGRLLYLFKLFKLVIRYLLENKIEAMIYLWIFMILGGFAISLFRRA